jgi:hypothetical protein
LQDQFGSQPATEGGANGKPSPNGKPPLFFVFVYPKLGTNIDTDMSLSHWYGKTQIDSKNLENVFENLENSRNIFAETTIT